MTGGTGFLGRQLVPVLQAAGHAVACIVRRADSVPPEWTAVEWACAGAAGQGVRDLCLNFRPDVTIHLAALFVNDHAYDDIAPLVEANVLLGAQLLEAMRESGCRAMVWAGSSWQHYEGHVYNPVNLYAATKQAFSALSEYYVAAAGLRMLELHLYDSYGEHDPRSKIVNLLCRVAKNGQVLDMSPGQQHLHLVHVADLVRGFEIAVREVYQLNPSERRLYRMPAQKMLTLHELVEIFNILNPQYPVKVRWGGTAYRQREVMYPWDAGQILPGWQAEITIEDGLRRVIDQQFIDKAQA